MAEPVEERPVIPPPTAVSSIGLAAWGVNLIKVLYRMFQQYGIRLNGSLNKDGREAMEAPLPLQSVEAADLPDAADHEGALVYVSDGGAGSKVRYSDGTNWVDLG